MPHATASDGVKLYYEETGKGDTVIFVHEFAGDHRSWEQQMRYFARRYRCVAYNARGYPPSDVPDDVEKYSQARARDDVVAVLDHLKVDKAHVVGLSMGGFATLHVGLGHPHRARSLVIAGCGYTFIYVKDPDDAETRRVLLETFQPLAGKAGSGIRRVLTREEVAALGGDPRVFLALEPADNWGFSAGYTGDLTSASGGKGQHGIPPDRPEINSSLLVYGPRIGTVRLEGVRMIDVAPSVARLLGLRLDRAEGRPLPIPIRPAPPKSGASRRSP